MTRDTVRRLGLLFGFFPIFAMGAAGSGYALGLGGGRAWTWVVTHPWVTFPAIALCAGACSVCLVKARPPRLSPEFCYRCGYPLAATMMVCPQCGAGRRTP